MNELIPPAEADARISSSLTMLPAENVPLSRAVGRRLLSPILADRALPPYNRSMMDGIAFKATTISAEGPIKIAGLHPAGVPSPGPLPPGHAWEIMTGAIVPDDCDTIVPYEQLSPDLSKIMGSFKPGQFIHPLGSDARSGATLVPAGVTIGAPEIAIAASVGQTTLTVPRRPKIGILTTGDEAIHPAAIPEPWQIRRSNGSTLAAILDYHGIPIEFQQHASDDEAELGRLLDQALDSVDMLITIGGISKGKKDFIRPLLEDRLGAPSFHGVSLRPGKPLAFWPGPPDVFALPGNPVSVLATFTRFVRPALNQLQGLPNPKRRTMPPEDIVPLSKLTWLLPLGNRRNPLPPGNSGDFSSIAGAVGVLEIPSAPDFDPESPLDFYPFTA
ncbi:molybdopterin molybdotransferase MoeA [Haloferula chungangensis]|uniref:Molybdopterin molybdenumtransferase n=1 Tax=Haloferula chungangensis TaxID=1048331 RepID=A0ABW2L605_9BACT